MRPSFQTLRAAMIDSQLRPNGVNDARVIAAFAEVPRERFVPARLAPIAYVDEDLAFAPGRFLMEPLVFGNLVMRAETRARDRLLVIGTGSGYEAAVLARLVGHVVALESDAALVRDARAAIEADNVDVVEGPLAAGHAAGAPYDIVLVNGAVEYIPDVILDQLADGGRFVGVVTDRDGVGHATVGRKAGGGFGQTAFMEVGVGTLPGFARPRGFVF